MERRYLVAILALAATFAIFSREFRSGYLAKLPTSPAQLQAEVACAKQYVAERLVARLEPFLDRTAPEQAQMVAELNLPEVVRVQQQITEEQVQLVRQADQQKCAAAIRAQREALRTQQAGQRALEIQIRNVERAQKLQDLVVIRSQELTDRANERAQRINAAVAIRTQEIAGRSLQRAQCALERSQSKLNRAQVQGLPIHINFTAPAAPPVTITIPAAPVAPTPTSF